MIPNDELLLLYRRMLRVRAFETRVGEIYATGELPGTLPVSLGLEAMTVGACARLEEGDTVIGMQPGHGHLLARDVPMGALMAELYGRLPGTNRGRGGTKHAAAFDRGVFGGGVQPAGVLLATGAALAAKLRGGGRIALAFFGEDAWIAGASHEGLTLAAALGLPAVFLCQTDLGAARGEAARAREEIVRRAEGYGLAATQVDGGDVLAVYAAVEEAVTRARTGAEASLIEARALRWSDSALPQPDEAAEVSDRDPVGRFIIYLAAHGIADESDLARIAREVDQELTEAVEFARASPIPPADEALSHVYGMENDQIAISNAR